jgi:hypothetical protein
MADFAVVGVRAGDEVKCQVGGNGHFPCCDGTYRPSGPGSGQSRIAGISLALGTGSMDCPARNHTKLSKELR